MARGLLISRTSTSVGCRSSETDGGRSRQMTQELVLGDLLVGLVGVVWAMTVSVLWTDQPVPKEPGLAASTEQQGGIDLDRNTSKRQTIAA